MIVATSLYPKAARVAADAHNDEFHDGVPTAHIDAEEEGVGLPHYKVWCSECKIVVMSPAGFLYGTISSITWNTMIINTTHRRRWDTIVRKWKKKRYLTKWEKIDPPRKMLAIGGRIVNIKPPEEV